ncbi:ATP-binding protein [Bacillus spizizenii]|uniref:AAA family ATPase n=1 Tax=Bacillus subtilis TaxID=1423 RepID=UPI00227DC076|nr:AAA family ATPase [Bacillus subtilis]MCY9056146.1 ATP-binding protein [Bacillus spizizenii]MCY9124983.1 ATP-binding protein [Bacillus spizizenii]MEC2335193.1 AAA family ATPase [Bacillus subtilis]
MGFRKPSTKRIGLKVLVTGQTGSGKSVLGLSFPKVAALDSEAGLALYEGDSVYGANLVAINNTMSIADMEEGIEEIEEMVEEDPNSVQTLVIDSETKFYQNLQHSALEVEEKRARRKGGDVMDTNLSVRSWGRIKQVSTKLQNLKIDLSAKGVHVISVSQVDDVKEKKGEQFVKVGEKPVMAKNAEYDYDIIINMVAEDDGKGGKKYKGEIKKDRTNVTKAGMVIDNPSYKIWKDYYEGRQGADTLQSNLSKDMDKDMNSLESEDLEKEKTTVDKLKELMTKNDEIKEKAVAMIKEKKIKNPLQPTASELKDLEEIVATLSKSK